MTTETINKRTTRKELIKLVETHEARLEGFATMITSHHEMIGVLRDSIDALAQAIDAITRDLDARVNKIVIPH